jgi:TonB family protein
MAPRTGAARDTGVAERDRINWRSAQRPLSIELTATAANQLRTALYIASDGSQERGLLIGRLTRNSSGYSVLLEFAETVRPRRPDPGNGAPGAEDRDPVFEEALRRWQMTAISQVVGFYRSEPSHAEAGVDPTFGEEDQRLAQVYFGMRPSLFLIVSPGPWGAAIRVCFWNGAEMWNEVAHELLMDRKSVQSFRPAEVSYPAMGQLEPQERVMEFSLPRMSWKLIAGIVILLSAGVIGYLSLRQPAQETAAAPAVVREAVGRPLSLDVHEDGKRLVVSWSPNAPAVQTGTEGVLLINDGGRQLFIALTRDQLRQGRAIYIPVTGQLTFELQVNSLGQGLTTEALNVLNGASAMRGDSAWSTTPVAPPSLAPPVPQPAALPPARQPAASAPAVSAQASKPASLQSASSSNVPPASVAPVKVDRPVPAAQETASAPTQQPIRPPASEPAAQDRADLQTHPAENAPRLSAPPKPVAVKPSPAQEQPVAKLSEPPKSTPAPAVPVPTAPPPAKLEPTVIASTAAQAPAAPVESLGGASRSRQEPAVVRSVADSAVPVKKVQPVIPPALFRYVTNDSTVNVQVHVSASGKVGKVEVLGNASPVLANLAEKAAKQWEFKPANVNGAPVPSVNLISFRFLTRKP